MLFSKINCFVHLETVLYETALPLYIYVHNFFISSFSPNFYIISFHILIRWSTRTSILNAAHVHLQFWYQCEGIGLIDVIYDYLQLKERCANKGTNATTL